MNIFISGGCKNGKSDFAQEIALKLAGSGKRYYVATMIPYDSEDRARVAKHITGRAGMGFETLELGRDISSCLEYTDKNAVYLVDSVTALLLNELFPKEHGGSADPDGVQRCRDGLLALAANVRDVVLVSDYIYSDAERYDEFTENYRRSLAAVDRALAEICDTVVELCAGNIILYKGELPK